MTSFWKTPSHLCRGTVVMLMILAALFTTGFKTVDAGRDTLPKQPRPFRATYQITPTIVGQSGNSLQLHVSGSGTATHLGFSTLEAQTTLNLQPVFLSGQATFTAADGDELYTTFTGAPIPNNDGTETLIRNYTVEGGTGRFADAAGSFTAYTIVVPPPTPETIVRAGSITMEGSISY